MTSPKKLAEYIDKDSERRKEKTVVKIANRKGKESEESNSENS